MGNFLYKTVSNATVKKKQIHSQIAWNIFWFSVNFHFSKKVN